MKQNVIICKESAPLIKKAIAALGEILLDYTHEYPICVNDADLAQYDNVRRFYIGTNKTLPHVSVPHVAEGYTVCVKNDTITIAGSDDAGVLYGCLDFYNRYIIAYEFPNDDRYCVNIFQNDLPEFYRSSYPAVKNRGLWTWGHVIYNYHGYIDNLVKLKMNTLVIWNDHVPVNAAEMVQYAHACGVKVLWGYAWGWDTDCTKISPEKTAALSHEIFAQYEKNYAPLGGDGIYFQSFTEINTQTLGGRVVAEAVTAFVNDTAALFFEKYPDLELQFGLHATSVCDNLAYIEKVNPKIRIVWENCGAFPFSYIPSDVKTFDETCRFVRDISVLRGQNDKFGVVTKGFTKLDWSAFQHMRGSIFTGVSSTAMKQNRTERKRKIWKYLQATWMIHADKAYEVVKMLSAIKNRDLYITPLVEDGMFEENIMYPVALFSEMLWDTQTPISDHMRDVALRDYVTFA